MKAVNRLKQFSEIGKDAKGFYFLCYGPDLLTLRSDLNKTLSVFETPMVIEITDVHSRQLPCVIVRGKSEELEEIKMYLATHERYTYR